MFTLVPITYWLVITFIFGVVIGSFLNVYVYRFHTGKSLMGSSHCLSCAKSLRWYELFPLFSYIGLRGRCRTCGAYIPSRYFWVELVTGLLFAAVVLAGADMVLWPLLFLLVATLVVITVYDIKHMIIAHEFVWVLVAIAMGLIGYGYYQAPDWWLLVSHAIAGLVAGLFFFCLWWYSSGRWIGLGDAKLAVPLGMMVGLYGVFSMIVLSFWVGTILTLCYMGYQRYQRRGQLRLPFLRQQLTMKSEVPFAPFLIVGFLLVFLGRIDVLTFFVW